MSGETMDLGRCRGWNRVFHGRCQKPATKIVEGQAYCATHAAGKQRSVDHRAKIDDAEAERRAWLATIHQRAEVVELVLGIRIHIGYTGEPNVTLEDLERLAATWSER